MVKVNPIRSSQRVPFSRRRVGAFLRWLAIISFASVGLDSVARAGENALQAAFKITDITPDVSNGRPVWLAGYGWGRKATGIHDPLYARCLVLSDGVRRFAMVSVDLVGMQLPDIERVRSQLGDFDYVMVSSTHNHEAPDTIGLWGKTPVQRGVDPVYIDQVVERIVDAVRSAGASLVSATATYGTATDESLVADSRLPVAKDGVLRLVQFHSAKDASPLGMVVQWNCHPEAMGPDNTLITADFPWAMIARLEQQFAGPVVLFSGAVGGLMAPPDHLFTDAQGRELKEGDFAYAEAYGRAVAKLATEAIHQSQPISLVPLTCRAAKITVPVENPLYRTARLLRVLQRKSVAWTGDFHETEQPLKLGSHGQFAVVTEIAAIQLGELSVACVPGELYPELVYGKFQEPADPNADHPAEPLEPTIQQMVASDKWLLIGLANDEIGYIIPKRQWDARPPYAYGRTKAQYGEVNSCGPMIAPIIMQALGEQFAALDQVRRASTPSSDPIPPTTARSSQQPAR
jgi:hypothetical protein